MNYKRKRKKGSNICLEQKMYLLVVGERNLAMCEQCYKIYWFRILEITSNFFFINCLIR